MRLNEIIRYDDIVIQCHDFPDADTLAAGYGVYEYLRFHGKSPRLIYGGKQKVTKPNLLYMIKELEIPVEYVSSPESINTLVTVDCCYGEGNVTRFDAESIFVIDHHRIAECKYTNEIRSTYSSCCSVVAQMLRDEDFDYNDNRKLATALYFGLYSDTNGMNEINHPADRDLRDLTDFDEITINFLKNSNLSLEEMKIAGDALKHYKYSEEYRFAIVETMPCDPNILGFISDLLLQVDKVDTCMVFCKKPFGTKLSVRSCINNIRANEMTEFITAGCGSGGGHAQKAGGYVNPMDENAEISKFIFNKLVEYHKSYDIIHASDFDVDMSKMKKYVKLPVNVGYVVSSDVLPEGAEMCIRTLEADLNVRSSSELYIMVGIYGEVYPIKKEKFMRSYTATLETFCPKTEYIPSVVNKNAFTTINLMPYIKNCVPAGTSSIYATELTRTVKVYTSWDRNNYMLGKEGDFLAARCDDLHDIYVVEKNIFLETYKESI